MFYSFYNHLTPKKENKNIKIFIELSNFMLNNLQEKNIFPYLEIQINELVPKEFENYKIFSIEKKVKEDNEVCFSICLLIKNIKLMIKFF